MHDVEYERAVFQAVMGDVRDVVWDAVERLPERERGLVRAWFWEGRDVEAIEESFGPGWRAVWAAAGLDLRLQLAGVTA